MDIKNTDIKVYFVGIGGINMSALAAYLLNKGFTIYGSDKNYSMACENLSKLGAKIFIGHDKSNIEGMDLLVVSSAISEDNEEIRYANENKIPIISRAELLAFISNKFSTKIGVSGAHGKTTVTSILTHILYENKLKFTSFIGGFDSKFDNFCYEGEDILLSEVCEFKRNINFFNADIAVTLNIDNDHLDSYESFSHLSKTFFNFLDRGETAVINIDDPILAKYTKPYISFGFNPLANYTATKISYKKFLKFTVLENGKKLFTVNSKLCGKHNIYNILASIAVARTLNIDKTTILNAITNFSGVSRRFELIGKINNANCFSDYAHHPREIEALLSSVIPKQKGELFVVFQPHTYSRTKLLFEEFIKVFSSLKNLIIFKTYSAREKIDMGYSAYYLSSKLKNSKYYENFEEIYEYLKENVTAKDLVLFIGAGDIDFFAREYLK